MTEDKGWIIHKESRCPVAPDTYIEIENGIAKSKGQAKEFFWGENEIATIVKYRILKKDNK